LGGNNGGEDIGNGDGAMMKMVEWEKPREEGTSNDRCKDNRDNGGGASEDECAFEEKDR